MSHYCNCRYPSLSSFQLVTICFKCGKAASREGAMRIAEAALSRLSPEDRASVYEKVNPQETNNTATP